MQAKTGIDYFFLGLRLIRTKGIKRFVFIPLIVNLLLFAAAFTWLFGQLEGAIAMVIDWIPSWLDWAKQGIETVLWPLALIVILLSFSYIFLTVANWLSAPFNGLLAEKVEQHLTGQRIADTSIGAIVKDTPRMLGREWQKLAYYLPRAIGFLLLFFLLPVIGQVLWFLFTAWMMAVQYGDYPFDNHKAPFRATRDCLGAHKGLAFGFGITTTLVAMVPVVNFLVMPVAICGATAMYVDRFRPSH